MAPVDRSMRTRALARWDARGCEGQRMALEPAVERPLLVGHAAMPAPETMRQHREQDDERQRQRQRGQAAIQNKGRAGTRLHGVYFLGGRMVAFLPVIASHLASSSSASLKVVLPP